MQTAMIKEKLHQFIDVVDDKRAQAIYMLFEDELKLNDARKNLIMEDRAAYLSGDNKTFSIDEVKQMALNKELRSGL
jgi:hypothetical protein